MAPSTAPLYTLVLAGGSGTRLWPRSTDRRPKPFLSLAGGESLLRQAFRRGERLAGSGNVLVSARRGHAELVARDLPELAPARLVLEPARRNTAPAIAVAALSVAAESEDAILAVLPSDQAVRDEEAFLRALEEAVFAARAEAAFVTLGVVPTRPETAYGYLETAEPRSGSSARAVVRFVEKPERETAAAYLSSGRFLWNAGIFVFRARHLLEEMDRAAPEVLAAARDAWDARRRGDEAGFDRAFSASPSISIDYAVMERASRVLTVPCACGWSDLGSWDAVFEFRGGDETTDVLEGPASSTAGRGNLILADDRPVRVIGLSGVAVIDAPDGILVMRRGESESLRTEVEASLAAAKGSA